MYFSYRAMRSKPTSKTRTWYFRISYSIKMILNRYSRSLRYFSRETIVFHEFENHTSKRIFSQSYIFFLQSNASDGAQSRFRKRGRDGRWSYTCTVRRPECKGQTIEVKTPLSRKDYEYLLNHTDEKRLPIFKTRRCFMYNNQSYQLDIYRWETAVKPHSKIDVGKLQALHLTMISYLTLFLPALIWASRDQVRLE